MKKKLYTCIILNWLFSTYTLQAQILKAGDAVVSMSSNLWFDVYNDHAPKYVLEVFRTKNTSAAPWPDGSGWQMTQAFFDNYSFKHPSWIRENMGNIFGLTLDNKRNIYATATGFYGQQVDGISTGQIWKIDGYTGEVSKFKDLHSTGQNPLSLGNIKFFNGFLYVSNIADGKIYVIDINNPTADHTAFDPGGKSDIRKPHGLAIRNVGGNTRLFYSLNEFDQLTTAIHSIGIIGTSFTGSENIEVTGFSIYESPVTDIAFSKDNNKMIIAERSTLSWTSSNAHVSSVIEFNYDGSSWVNINTNDPHNLTDQNPAYILGPTTGDNIKKMNAAGGISFSQVVLQSNNIIRCDTTIWATSDMMTENEHIYFPNSQTFFYNKFYGMVGFRHRFGAGTPSGIIIDFDNNIESNDKSFLGDVEICDTTINCANCSCGQWPSSPIRLQFPGSPFPLLKTCGSSSTFTVGQLTGTLNAIYNCAGNCSNSIISWKLINAITNIQITSGNLGANPLSLNQFNNLQCGDYKIIFTPTCGGTITCSPCEYLINIVCEPPSCCTSPINISSDNENATYTSSSNPNGFGIYRQEFTLNGSMPMGEIRIDVEHFEITSSESDCIPCKNLPKTWGSLNGASFNGNGFIKPINTLPFSSSLFSNGRELIYKPGSIFSINNGVIKVNVAMPNASLVDCGVLTANLCLKFTFKDAQCRECIYLVCVQNIEIKKSENGNPNGNKLKSTKRTVQKVIF